MSSELKFPATFQTDTEFVERALLEYRQQFGFAESVQFGDLDRSGQRWVLAKAQALKKEGRENG
jgi:hypothetical protein